MVECPECETIFALGRRRRVEDIIECPECGAQLEIISVDPIEVDLVGDDVSWSREEEDEEEDELLDAWECGICGHIHDGRQPPDRCPECGAEGEQFDYLEDDSFDDEEYDYDYEDEFAN